MRKQQKDTEDLLSLEISDNKLNKERVDHQSRKVNMLEHEITELKHKLNRIKTQKSMTNTDSNTSVICCHCGLKFTESTNFNWSCKTHSSPWQGEMYWCCGRNRK